ncbi:DNA utilization protein GntX [Shimwellia blattae]|uniref:Protein GntX n=1 Tax=Shimwellia blattae (strain ATCC 29907 / DSM 4481 / JCM 1650 / NBRC 105725 / CDC 9005-74) TaxID=630626 RepID=I2B497_SHIBC|nr:DNA utilization protein GntX [Shimwellia blattae]AFJ45351.1 protein GntX [Shimwellia blattae DSM 4481 = NBRC 105725]GAB80537.1 GntX protein [Shimwellia blattae DSM 4481 = NBRC 105725]VDY62833.1 DNA utilization protein GntX [Shimwellia blattae]VEC19720.1 DNA utilization protein GntX [Shimwellia blattae]
MLTIPGLCWLCAMPLHQSHWGICSYCQRALAPPPCCPCCGLPAISGALPCGRCLLRPPPWQRLVMVDDYRPPLRRAVQQFKFNRVTALAPALARLMLLRILAERRSRHLPRVDLILAVPLHHHRAWRRGYNQSDLLARYLARWTGCSYVPGGLRRVKSTRVQHRLSAPLRRRNLRRAFSLEIPVQHRHIAIVDDVVTTGSTVAEITRLLMRHGAATVQIWCLCRTL